LREARLSGIIPLAWGALASLGHAPGLSRQAQGHFLLLSALLLLLNPPGLGLCLWVAQWAEVAEPYPGKWIVLEGRFSRLELAAATFTWRDVALRDAFHISQVAGQTLADGDDLVDARLIVADFRPRFFDTDNS